MLLSPGAPGPDPDCGAACRSDLAWGMSAAAMVIMAVARGLVDPFSGHAP